MTRSAVDLHQFSTICIPCENGSTKGIEAVPHGLHTPYDYNEVL